MFPKKYLPLLITSLIGFIDVMGVGLVYPMFAGMLFRPDCAMLSPDTSEFARGAYLGLLLATMPMVQFFSGPLLGMLSDQHGRRKILVPSLWVGVLGYFFAYYAVVQENLLLLILSRVAVGISAGTAAIVSAVLADISQPEDKAKNFGILNMALGLGFTVGPFVGGCLSIWGYSLPFAMAGIATAGNAVLSYFFLKETYVPRGKQKVDLLLGLKNIFKAFKIPRLQIIFTVIFIACTGWSFYWEFTPVTWISKYGFSTTKIGSLYAFGAFVYAICCGFLVGPIVKRFSNDKIFYLSLFGCAVFMGALYFNTSPEVLFVYIALQQMSISFFWPTAATAVSNSVGADVQGETMGVMQSMDSLAFGISPLIAGPLLGLTPVMPILLGSFCMGSAGVLFFYYHRKALKAPANT